jgi:hypothetical protein
MKFFITQLFPTPCYFCLCGPNYPLLPIWKPTSYRSLYDKFVISLLYHHHLHHHHHHHNSLNYLLLDLSCFCCSTRVHKSAVVLTREQYELTKRHAVFTKIKRTLVFQQSHCLFYFGWTVKLLLYNRVYYGVMLIVCETVLRNLWDSGVESVRFYTVLNKRSKAHEVKHR